MGKSWCVVEFPDGVQIVPQLWIVGDQCYWPTFMNSQKLYEKAVKEYKEPDETWVLYSVRILGVYDSYESAVPKLKVAEIQSDLNTDYEREETSKKSRSSRKRIILSSDEEQESDEEIAGIKPFPKMQKKNAVLETDILRKNTTIWSTNNDYPTPTNKSRPNNNGYSTPSTSKDVQIINSTTIPPTTDCCICCCKFDKEFKKKTENNISEIKNQLKLVLQILRDPQTARQTVTDGNTFNPEEYEGKLPMKTENDLNTWEIHLRSQDEQKKLISFLAKIGGHDINTVVKNILRKLFSDSVATLYNWEGKKAKKMFSALIISDCIKKAAVLSPNVAASKSITEQDIIAAIKNWLRHASARLSNRQKKNESAHE